MADTLPGGYLRLLQAACLLSVKSFAGKMVFPAEGAMKAWSTVLIIVQPSENCMLDIMKCWSRNSLPGYLTIPCVLHFVTRIV